MAGGARGQPGASVLGHVVRAFQPIAESVIIQGKDSKSGHLKRRN